MEDAEALYGRLGASDAPEWATSRYVPSHDAETPARTFLDPPQPDAVGDGDAEAESVDGGDVDGDADALPFSDQSVGLAAGASGELGVSHR